MFRKLQQNTRYGKIYFLLNLSSIILRSNSVGFTYATYGGLTITAIAIFGVIKYNQMPNLYGIIGIALIIVGVILLNTLGKTT